MVPGSGQELCRRTLLYVKTCARHGTILKEGRRCELCDHHHDGAGLQSRHTAAWRRYSRTYLRTHPLCEECKAKGLTVPATEVHHHQERSQGGPLFPGEEGVAALCKPCHSTHSALIQQQAHTAPLTFTQQQHSPPR